MVELIFATKRLYARKWNAVMDAESILAIYGDAEVIKFLSALRPVQNLDEAMDFMERRLAMFEGMPEGCGHWAVELQEDKEVVGGVMLKYLPDGKGDATGDIEVGWHFRRESWGNGYATEAAGGAISHAFRELGVREVNAVMHPENTRSIKVAERLGMRNMGITREYYGVEALHYCIHLEDWGVLH